MAENKKQHYVSATYLFGFCSQESQESQTAKKNRRKTKLWQYDRRDGTLTEKSIDKLAISNYLYSFQNNDSTRNHALDDEIRKSEEKWQRAINTIETAIGNQPTSCSIKRSILGDGIDMALDYIYWQIKRHPNVIQDIESKCKEYLSENGEGPLRAREMALTVIGSIGSSGEYDIIKLLKNKNKTIVHISGNDKHFITTDNPLCRFRSDGPNGIGYPETEIYFPLSSRMLLLMNGEGGRLSVHLEGHRSFIRSVNAYMARNSHRLVFGQSEQYLTRLARQF